MKPNDRLREHIEEITLGEIFKKVDGGSYSFTAGPNNVIEYQEVDEDGELIEHWYSDPEVNNGDWLPAEAYFDRRIATESTDWLDIIAITGELDELIENGI